MYAPMKYILPMTVIRRRRVMAVAGKVLARAGQKVGANDTIAESNLFPEYLLLDVARDPKNSKSAEAKDLLELFLEEDYGTDWATWQTKMTEWLKENPD